MRLVCRAGKPENSTARSRDRKVPRRARAWAETWPGPMTMSFWPSKRWQGGDGEIADRPGRVQRSPPSGGPQRRDAHTQGDLASWELGFLRSRPPWRGKVVLHPPFPVTPDMYLPPAGSFLSITAPPPWKWVKEHHAFKL